MVRFFDWLKDNGEFIIGSLFALLLLAVVVIAWTVAVGLMVGLL